jgi:hypothetical protein
MPDGRTFVGFGLVPIQLGLFLHEVRRSGCFARTVVAEVDADLVAAVRAAGGQCTINIASAAGVRQAELTDVEVYHPRQPAGREAIVSAVAGGWRS